MVRAIYYITIITITIVRLKRMPDKSSSLLPSPPPLLVSFFPSFSYLLFRPHHILPLSFSRSLNTLLAFLRVYPLLRANKSLRKRGIFQFTRVHRRCGSSTRFQLLATSSARHSPTNVSTRKISSYSRSYNVGGTLSPIRSWPESVNVIVCLSFPSLLCLLFLLSNGGFKLLETPREISLMCREVIFFAIERKILVII